jgi:GntR family histidine utilization transcriptional repressor
MRRMVAAESTTRIADIKSRDSTAGVNRAPYARVKQHLKQGLASGRWPPGSLMPSEAELVAAFNVSRMTVNRALRELQAEGLVHRTQGVGTFAAQLHKVSSQLTINDLHDEIVARGHEHHAVVHQQHALPAPAPLAAQLGVASGATVFHTLIVHFENGAPLQCEDRYVNPACAPGYLQADFTRTTPTHWLFSIPICGARSIRSKLQAPPCSKRGCWTCPQMRPASSSCAVPSRRRRPSPSPGSSIRVPAIR